MTMRVSYLFGVTLLGMGVTALTAQLPAQEKGGWGAVSGSVVFEGKPPLPRVVDRPDGPVQVEEFVINPENKGVRWVFVWLEAPLGKELPVHPDLRKPKAKEVFIDVGGLHYTPAVVGLREGQALVVKNPSATARNFWWSGQPHTNPGGNLVLAAGATTTVTNLKADNNGVHLRDMIHPWMEGWLRVFRHPYFAVTDADGNFVIRNAPAGEWRLKVWHWRGGYAQGGKKGVDVTVRDRGQANFTFTIKAP
jgi:hypothetical protein